MLAHCSALIAVLLLCSPVPGQVQDDPRSIDFDGGSAVEYVQLLQETWKDANIVVHDNVDVVTLPPIQLRSVMLQEAIMLLDGHSTANGRSRLVVRRQKALNPVYSVHAMVAGGRSYDVNELEAIVVSVGDIVSDAMPAEELLAAVEAALGLYPDAEATQVRYHVGTKLLIARGPEQQVRTVMDVVVQLHDATRQREAREQMRSEAKAAIQERDQLLVQIEDLSQEVSSRDRMLIELQTRFEAATRQVEHVSQLETELRAYRSEMAAMETVISQLRKQLEDKSGG
jgi:hypothetical protein